MRTGIGIGVGTPCGAERPRHQAAKAPGRPPVDPSCSRERFFAIRQVLSEAVASHTSGFHRLDTSEHNHKKQEGQKCPATSHNNELIFGARFKAASISGDVATLPTHFGLSFQMMISKRMDNQLAERFDLDGLSYSPYPVTLKNLGGEQNIYLVLRSLSFVAWSKTNFWNTTPFS